MSNDKILSPAIRAALAELRLRIRAYVVAEGLAMAAIWIGLTFWVGLAVDYLPVLAWASEIPRGVRAVALLLVAGVLAWLLYQWVFRRVFVRLRDRSMALLVERRFQGFSDELVTAVELSETGESPFDQEMIDRTELVADAHVRKLRLADVFSPAPLIRKLLVAALLLLPIIPFAVFQQETARTWFERFYLLRDVSWPRDTIVQVNGFQPQRTAGAMRQEGPAPLRAFADGQPMKIAKGSSGTLRVQAKSRSGQAAPSYCTVYYRSSDGVRSSVRMNKLGRLSRDGFQEYTLASKPFKGVLEDLSFDIVANDSRLRGYQLNVVESPLVVDARLRCEFPEYLVDETTSSWLPREQDYVASGTMLPSGTKVTMTFGASKPLAAVEVQVGEEGAARPVKLLGPQSFAYEIAALKATTTLLFTLLDTDGVRIERPAKFVVAAIKDNPPELKVTHRGIGAMVTPDVRIPVEGTASDDYRIARAWFELATPDGRLREFEDLSVSTDGELAGGLDLRSKRGSPTEAPGAQAPIEDPADFQPAAGRKPGEESVDLKPGDRIAVTVMAADYYNLGEPNVGVGVRMDLEVVTPERLLTALDHRELAQRRMFEHVIEEITSSKDDLSRVLRGLEGGGLADLDPGEEADEEKLRRRATALRVLRVQQASLQSEKSGQETLGVAAAFEDIVLELRNNRVDSQDRQERLTQKISEPLRLIGETMFPELDQRLEGLENAVGENKEDQTKLAQQAVTQVEDILAEMDKVLADMLYIETYNELVETVRLIMEEQARIKSQTDQELKRSLFDE